MSGALAVILARAGSKGVPGKNLRLVGGRACVMWTIDAAKAAKQVSRVVLSTDSAELREMALAAGIDVVARPAELASDTAPVDDATRHAVRSIEDAGNSAVEDVVILYGNVPVRPDGLIDRAIDMLCQTKADSVQSYAPVGKHHPWWTAVVDDRTGSVKPWEGDVLNHGIFRRQDLPPAHIPDGGVLVVTRRALFHEIPGVAPGPHAFFGAKRAGIVNPEGSVIDIDSETDLLVADAVLHERHGDRELELIERLASRTPQGGGA